ncbi:YALI0B22748p [Yarrowia lipolytica CLIB122]|uniref:YALI0B22748p n=2 Tax=Yarrowia lipolytica TaxID=4952 RepID=Q6CDM7_YARLI|nr:YALI0B22748p [Yarrowia lipolytica CLIB122]AOW02089.1 hypothetical protein YALI1_B29711g [Yarrowia lipolytica]KAJ8052851.1 hypothetical protein LXG23DRAFT_25151 [Yarrowia lipolytica]CAG83488.1 YALI0B22748p [Yarrowia lipolytica CLIB122]|eukprot:XP_501235.1 YALI0B22748p [Yarrowia lipolytica CLIB122]
MLIALSDLDCALSYGKPQKMTPGLDTVPQEILEQICVDCDPWSIYQLSNTSKSLRVSLLEWMPQLLKSSLVTTFFPLDKDAFASYDYLGLKKRISKEMSVSVPLTLEEAITRSLAIQKNRTSNLPLVVKTDEFVHPDANLAVGKTHSWIGVEYEPAQDSNLLVLSVNGLFAIYEINYTDGSIKLMHLSEKDSWWRSNEGWLVSGDAEWKLDFTFSDAPECTSHHPYAVEFVSRNRKSAVVHRRRIMAYKLGEAQELKFEVNRKYDVAKKWWNFNDRFSIARFIPRDRRDSNCQLFLVNWETMTTQFLAATPVWDSNYFQFQNGFVYMNEGSIKLRVMNKLGKLLWFQVTDDNNLRVNRYYPNWEITTMFQRHSWTPNDDAKQVFGMVDNIPHLWSFSWEFQAWFATQVFSEVPSWKAGDDWEGWQGRVDISTWNKDSPPPPVARRQYRVMHRREG